MKKQIFQLIPILVTLIACTGYSYSRLNGGLKPSNEDPSYDKCKSCEICPPCKSCEPCCEPCCTDIPKTGEPCNCAYNAPARIDPACGWNGWLSLSFIYWQPKEQGLDLGVIYSDSKFSHQVSDALNMNLDYHPGFKIGAGFSMKRDDWTLYLEYTRLKSDDSTSKEISEVYEFRKILSDWLMTIQGKYAFDAFKARWELSYNMFDLEMGRPYYLGKKLIFKSHFGLRGGWINQKYNIEAYSAILDPKQPDVFGRHKQDSWLIGPRMGLDTDWLIGCDLRIFGNIAGSLLYQNFEIYTKENYLIESTTMSFSDRRGKNETNYLTPNVEFALGLGYGRYFRDYRWYFDLTVGYDFHYFWNQNMMRQVKDNQMLQIDDPAGDLMLHGLTITARLDF